MSNSEDPINNIVSFATRKPVSDELIPCLSDTEEPDLDGDRITDIIMVMMARMHEEIGEKAWASLDQAVLILSNSDGNEFVFTNSNIMGPELLGALETAKLISFDTFMSAVDPIHDN